MQPRAACSWKAIEEEARAVAQDLGIKLRDVAPPLRAALTGRTVPRGVFDVLFVLGGDESLERDEEKWEPGFPLVISL